MVRGSVSEGYGERHFGLEASDAALQREDMFCVRLTGQSQNRCVGRPRLWDKKNVDDDHLAAGPDEDDGRDAKGQLRIPVGAFYEMKVHVCRIILIPDGPRDRIRWGQLGWVTDEGFDDYPCI